MSARVVVSCRGGLVDAGSAASTCPSRLPRAPRRVSHARARRDRRPRAVSTDSPSTDEERTASARPRRRPGIVPLDEYLRLVELADGAWELQSATAVFRRRGATPGDVREVTLAATVHVADADDGGVLDARHLDLKLGAVHARAVLLVRREVCKSGACHRHQLARLPARLPQGSEPTPA